MAVERGGSWQRRTKPLIGKSFFGVAPENAGHCLDTARNGGRVTRILTSSASSTELLGAWKQ